jgi:hypothetical protein
LSAVAQSGSRSSSPMATRAPSGLVAEYNPQQWGARGPAGGAYIPHSALPPSTRRNVDDGGKRYFSSAHIHILAIT